MPKPLSKHNNRYRKKQDKNVDARLSAKRVHVSSLCDPWHYSVEKAKGYNILEAINKLKCIGVDGEIAVAYVGHRGGWNECETDRDETVAEEATEVWLVRGVQRVKRHGLQRGPMQLLSNPVTKSQASSRHDKGRDSQEVQSRLRLENTAVLFATPF